MSGPGKALARREDLVSQIEKAGLQIHRHKIEALRNSEKPRITEMDPTEYTQIAQELLRYLWKDFGMQGIPEQYDYVRFSEFLVAYFRDFSLDEIKLAFEYFLTGELEGYVRDNLNHYGRWSIQFATEILKGYRKYRGAAITDTRRLLPDPKERELTEEEKDQIDLDWRRGLYLRIQAAIQEGKELPRYFYSDLSHRTLCKVGLLEPREITDDEVEEGFGKFLARTDVQGYEKKKYREDYENGKLSGILKRTVINHAIRKDIDGLIQEGDLDRIREKFIEYENNRNRSREE